MSIEVLPITPVIGACVRGIDLARPLSAVDKAALDRALHDHLVLYFDEQAIDDRAHRDFAAQFGELEGFPLAYEGEDRSLPEVHFIAFDDGSLARNSRVDSWHTDGSYMVRPPNATLLRAVELPEVGGDTLFASMYAAYDALSEPIKELLAGLTAAHDYAKVYNLVVEQSGDPAAAHREMRERYPVVHHPIVQTHPDTGRRFLYINRNYTTAIDGLTERENETLLELLFDHVRDPAFQCRISWRLGALALWDNRCTQHYGVPDYRGRRRMNRVVVNG
jgi:taurine dioxygenase